MASVDRAAVPAPIRVDPLAVLVTTPVSVDMAGRTFNIMPPKADYWLMALMDDPIDWDMILPGLLSEADQLFIEDAIYEGEMDPQDLIRAITDMLNVVTGMDWWVAIKLCSVMRNSWDRLGGELVLRGVDPTKLTFPAWLLAAFSLVMERVDPKEAANFVAQLTTPPEGYEQELDEAREGEAFLAAMGMG